MDGPFMAKTVSRIHPGKAAEYRPLVEEICDLAEEASHGYWPSTSPLADGEDRKMLTSSRRCRPSPR